MDQIRGRCSPPPGVTTVKYIAALALLVACGDNMKPNQEAEPDAPAPDAAFAEAPHGMPPQVQAGPGGVMATVKVVPIFFTGDAAQPTIEQFLTLMPGSSYWTATTSEYGVGAISIQPSVVSTAAPPTTDADLETMLGAMFPNPDPGTIYTVFLPDGASLDDGGGKSCVAFGGYHSEIADFGGGSGSTTPPAGNGMIYALIPRCAPRAGGQPLDEVTIATSHELIEAATDPHPFTNEGYVRLDQAHYIWNRTPGGELGDMCEYVELAEQPLLGSFMVQRTWSNASAAAGHDPCVPEMANGYIGAAPNFTDADTVMVNSRAGAFATQGVTVNNGESHMLELDIFSDVDTQDTVSVEAMDLANFLNTGTPQLAYQMGATSVGGNGSKLQLLITRTKAGTGRNAEFVVVTKRNNKISGLWFGLVAGQ